ncbi:MAG: hypothetical protein AB7I68_00210 [Porticoccaceae bacterium]
MSDTATATKTTGTKSTESKAKSKPASAEMQRFLDALTANQSLMWEAMESARKRGIRISNVLAATFAESQQDFTGLACKLALSPRDYKSNFTAAIESLTRSQSRTMDLFKALLSEQTQSRDATRKIARELYDGSKEATAAAMEAGKALSAANPFTESASKAFAGFRKVATAAREAMV